MTATEVEAEQQEVPVEEVPVNEQQVPEEQTVPVEGEPTVEPDCEVSGDESEDACKPAEVAQDAEESASAMVEPLSQKSESIDLKAALVGFSTWAIARSSTKKEGSESVKKSA